MTTVVFFHWIYYFCGKKNTSFLIFLFLQVHGMEAGGDDDDDLDEQLNSMIKTKRRVVHGRIQSGDKPTSSGNQKADKNLEKRKAEALQAAELLNSRLKGASQAPAPVEKNAAQLTAEAVMRGGEVAPAQMSAAMLAKQVADKLNEKLNYLGGGFFFWKSWDLAEFWFLNKFFIEELLEFQIFSVDLFRELEFWILRKNLSRKRISIRVSNLKIFKKFQKLKKFFIQLNF